MAHKRVVLRGKVMEELREYERMFGYSNSFHRAIYYTDRNESFGYFEVIFDYDGNRYYCEIEAIDMNEALGIFYKNHPHIAYDMIAGHIEW